MRFLPSLSTWLIFAAAPMFDAYFFVDISFVLSGNAKTLFLYIFFYLLYACLIFIIEFFFINFISFLKILYKCSYYICRFKNFQQYFNDPKKDCNSVNVAGLLWIFIVSTLSWSAFTLCLLTIRPRNYISCCLYLSSLYGVTTSSTSG